jgi:hypothetical protein
MPRKVDVLLGSEADGESTTGGDETGSRMTQQEA